MRAIFSPKQKTVKGADAFQWLHCEVGETSRFIPGAQSVDVGGGGDDRRRVEEIGNLPGQGVGAAEMAGQEADHKLAAFIEDDNRRIARFAL